MEIDVQQSLLIAQVRSMAILLDSRLGDDNPWRSVKLDELSLSDLASAKKLMHELLYSPPPRQ
jgi:hypothetical protein